MPNPDQFNFNTEELLRKYEEERQRRLRSDGNSQYVKIEGKFSHFLEDPYLTVSSVIRSKGSSTSSCWAAVLAACSPAPD